MLVSDFAGVNIPMGVDRNFFDDVREKARQLPHQRFLVAYCMRQVKVELLELVKMSWSRNPR